MAVQPHSAARSGGNLPGLDLHALAGYLDTHVEIPGGRSGQLTASVITGGRSNLTYEVSDGQHRWVLRRPPLGHVLETAHDMGREVRVLNALAGTVVPVPRVVAYCGDEAVIGAPFYLMDFVDGVLYRTDEQLDRLRPEEASALANQLVDVLADLHLVDYEQVGLGNFGRPDGYLRRQLRRWGKQLQASRTQEVPGFDTLTRRLSAAVPRSQRGCIVHGDYRLDNAVIAAEWPGRVRAILDWEMATLGDPLADLGLFLVYWDGWVGLDNPIAATPGDHAAFPRRELLIERYARRTGLDVTDLDWYLGFAFYKIAVILEGIHHRYVRGLTVGEGFDRIGAMVPALVQRGLAALEC